MIKACSNDQWIHPFWDNEWRTTIFSYSLIAFPGFIFVCTVFSLWNWDLCLFCDQCMAHCLKTNYWYVYSKLGWLLTYLFQKVTVWGDFSSTQINRIFTMTQYKHWIGLQSPREQTGAVEGGMSCSRTLQLWMSGMKEWIEKNSRFLSLVYVSDMCCCLCLSK